MGRGRTRATILMGGGIDSAACAHLLKVQGMELDTVFIDYGQPAAKFEAQAVATLARHLQLPTQRFTFSGGGSFRAGEIIGRNAFFVFAALLHTRGQAGLIVLGLHAGTPYYDCSEVFVTSIAKLVSEYTDGHVSVLAPFIEWTKKDVFDYFVSASLPLHLTYSCEAGTEPICGVCASCCDRKALGC